MSPVSCPSTARADAQQLHLVARLDQIVTLRRGGHGDAAELSSLELDDLRLVPIRVVEDECRALGLRDGNRDAVGALEAHAPRRERLHHHLGAVLRLARQDHRVAVGDTERLRDHVRAARGDDSDRRLVVIRHVRRDPYGLEARVLAVVLRVHQMRDETAVTQQVVADDVRSRTVHEERVAAEPAGDIRNQPGSRAADEEAVIALGAIEIHGLDTGEENVQPRAEDTVLRHHEVVAELGADDDDGIEAVAAVDVHRRVHCVLNEVRARVSAHVRALAQIFLRAEECERTDQKDIVAVVPEERERRQVVIDDELVVLVAAEDTDG
jgi:hypothetical protein